MCCRCPFGYRYVRKNDHAEACYEIVPHEAALVAELFAHYADGGVTIGALARWLSGLGVPSRTGKTCWDRSVIWAMLRNPAYVGRACFGKTMRTDQTAGLNRTAAPGARPHGTTPSSASPRGLNRDRCPRPGRPRHRERVQRRLADKRYASRNSTNPSLLQGNLRLRQLRIRLLPHLDPHHEQDRLLLPMPRFGQLPLPARPGLQQQTGACRSPRRPRLGPHRHPARRTDADPGRNRAATAHRRPPTPHRATPTPHSGLSKLQRSHQTTDRRLPGTIDHPR